MKKLLLTIFVTLILGCGSQGGNDDPVVVQPDPEVLRVCLYWDHVVHPDLAGYNIYYGKVSEQYDFTVEVEKDYNEVCIEDDTYFVNGGSYYFVATAFSEDEESDYSNEVIWEPKGE